MHPGINAARKPRGKRHPITRIWLVRLAVMMGITALSFISVFGIFLIVPYLPAFALCMAALGFLLSARLLVKRFSRHLCFMLCIVLGIAGIAGFPLIHQYFVNRPEPSLKEVQALLYAHEKELRAAADKVKPGERFPAWPQAKTAEPDQINRILSIPGVEAVMRSEDGAYVRFTIHFPNYFGHEGDYRSLSYVKADEMALLIPQRFADMQPVETNANSSYYVLNREQWVDEWYAQRLASGWFYEAEASSTQFLAQGKARFIAK